MTDFEKDGVAMYTFRLILAILMSMVFSYEIDRVHAAASGGQADLVIRNGTIYTMDEQQPTAEMIAVRDGRIVHVGDDAAADAWIGENSRVLDLAGKTLTPGWIESHAHILMLGRARMKLDLSRAGSYEDLIRMVAEKVKTTPNGEWIIGRGWHQSKWEPPPEPLVKGFQTHEALSRVSPDNPVFLEHASGHAGFANARAMKIAGIAPQRQSDAGGEIIRDAAGNPTGIFTENAQALIRQHIPDRSEKLDRQALELAIEESLANGLTSFRDAASDRDAIRLYHDFLKEGKLGIRLWVMINGQDEELLGEWFTLGPEVGSGDQFLTIRAVKLFADGALGSRGAWLLEPYSDRTGHTGHATISMDRVYQVSSKALRHGFQTCVHAIGDRANREVLDQFEKVFRENPEAARDHRFRIEHAQHISAADIPRFSELGVIASMQGIHLSSDRPWAINRLGEARIREGAYVWQKLLQSGAVVVNGTDAPVEPLNPIECFYASVTRRTLKGEPPGGYEPDQKMTRYQALRSYTLDGAYAGFEEDIKGSVEVGKLADFTVFSQDIMEVTEDRLLDTRVEYTIVGGDIAYARNPM